MERPSLCCRSLVKPKIFFTSCVRRPFCSQCATKYRYSQATSGRAYESLKKKRNQWKTNLRRECFDHPMQIFSVPFSVFQCEILHWSHSLCSVLSVILVVLTCLLAKVLPEEVVAECNEDVLSSTRVRCYHADLRTSCAFLSQQWSFFLFFFLLKSTRLSLCSLR